MNPQDPEAVQRELDRLAGLLAEVGDELRGHEPIDPSVEEMFDLWDMLATWPWMPPWLFPALDDD